MASFQTDLASIEEEFYDAVEEEVYPEAEHGHECIANKASVPFVSEIAAGTSSLRTATITSPSPSPSVSDLSVPNYGSGEETEPRLSCYQSSVGSEHPLADLRLRTASMLGPASDSMSELDGAESVSMGSSLGALSLSLSHVVDEDGSATSLSKPVRVRMRRKTKMEFSYLRLIQELSLESPPSARGGNGISYSDGATDKESIPNRSGLSRTASSKGLYVAKFSPCGNYLAVAGEDGLIRIWKLLVEDTMALMAEDRAFQPPRTASIFQPNPLQVLTGHESSVLDVCWSRNNFLLSASMDKTVRLWHYSRDDCLGVFRHPDFVTAVAFHPRDDRMFVTGSLDCRLRVWSIADRSVKAWNELPSGNYITAVCFSNSGKVIYAGTHTGVCLIFETEGFSYTSQIHVHSRRGKNSIGRKICGITPMPGNSAEDKRLSSDDGEYVISGSEDKKIYIWNVENQFRQRSFFTRSPSNHVKSCEFFETHSKAVPCAIFAPSSVQNRLQSVGLRPPLGNEMNDGQIVVAVDLNGKIKVYENNYLLDSWVKQR